MLNIEKYTMKVFDILIGGYMMGLKNNEPTACNELDCGKCDLCRQGCCYHTAERKYASYMRSWATTEYVEKPKLTKKEKQLLELVETGWITRDYDSSLWWFSNKPIKCDYNYCWKYDCGAFVRLSTLSKFGVNFEFITWSDKEPWSVEDLFKLEVEE